jgi:hypothetical protein
MTRHDHIDGAAAGIASLPSDDPERLAACEHARLCARCSEALRQAEELLAIVDGAAPPAPSPAALRRLARDTSAAIGMRPRPSWTYTAPGVLLAWLAALMLAKSRASATAAWVESVAVFVIALCAVLAASRARALALVSALGASIVVALITGTAWSGLMLLHGIKCITVELIAATLPYGAVVLSALRRRDAEQASSFAAVAAAGALAGQGALLVTCPERAHTPHLLLAHVTGVALAAALGWIGHRFVARRVEA